MLNPLSEADSWAQQGNHNTERKTTSDLRRLSEWLRSNKGETRRPENIPPADLDELLGAYFLDVRKLHNGDEYEPDSLAAIQRSVDRHLRGHSYCCSIITDPRFKYSNECLLFKKKSLKAAGKGNRPNKAEPISAEEVRFLLDKKLLGPYSAESLINSLWYVNTVHLGIKGQKGHTTLLWGDVEKKADASGREYIEYHERTTKTLSGRTGIEPRPPEPPRAWGDPNNPLLCPVRLYDEYAKRRPPQSTYPTTRFYLSKYHGKRDDVWFIDIPMGKNTVGQIMKVMATKAYGAILNESGLNDIESRHLAKRAKQNANDNGEGSSISEDSSDESVILEDPPSNQMNNSLVSLYRKGNPDSGTSSPKGERSATGSPATVSTPLARTRAHHPSAGGTQVSTGGWFIDKRPEQSILIDLREEDAASPAIKREESDVSMLEPENTKKKGKLKRSKKRKGETGSVDEDIESSILNKKAKTKATELQYSTVKFEDVGGNDATLTELCKLLIHMRHPEVYSQLGVVPPRGFLLHGPPGCGKTLMAQAVAGELELPMLKVSAPELVSGVSGESEQKLRELFDQAVTNAPCILFIDEIDSITPKREMASKDMERRIVAQLLTCMDDLNSLAVTAQVLVIGATNRPDSLDPALRRAGRFDREICLGIPDEAARLRILKTLCRKLKLPEDFDYRQLARLTPGYVGADLMALCREAAMCAVNRVLLENQSQLQIQSPCSTDIQTNEPLCTAPVKQEMELVPPPPEPEQQGELARLLLLLKSTESVSEEQLAGLSILMTDFQASLACVQPSAKREGFATVPDVTWEDVGALQDIREELTMAILAPVRNPEQFKALGLNAPAGVLLAGPPGCGKTLLAKAVANESGLNFISVKGPELLNMYVGESERAVRQVFQRGRSSAPCVIFFDEIDALCPRRSGHESGAGVRVVNQLLTEMDGLECRRQVFIMAATNRPDIIDPAVLRPGRLDKTLYVGLPPPQDRHAILLTITKGGTKPPLELDVSLEEIAHDNRCDCFTGADLSALVREASVNALRAHLKSQSTPAHSGHVFSNGVVADIRVSKQNFEDAFKKVRPSVSKKDQLMYERLKESLAR